MQGLVLAVGMHTNTGVAAGSTPAPLLPIDGAPLLLHTLDWLKRYDVTRVAVAFDRAAQEVEETIDGGPPPEVDIVWSSAADHLGTAGAAKQLEDFFDDTFVVVHGELLLDIDLAALVEYHRARRGLVTIGLVHTDDPPAHHMVQCDSMGGVVRFAVNPQSWTSEQRTASAGIFVAEPEVLAHIPDDRLFNWEDHLFPLLVARGDLVFAQLLDGTVVDMSIPGAYEGSTPES
jgi:NDP-sugar pyrophosphorylase family protein